MLLLSLDCSTLPWIHALYCWVLSETASSTICWVFGITRSAIELQSPGPLTNTLLIRPMKKKKKHGTEWLTDILINWLIYLKGIPNSPGICYAGSPENHVLLGPIYNFLCNYFLRIFFVCVSIKWKKKLNRFIRPIDGTLAGTATSDQNEFWRNVYEGLLHIPTNHLFFLAVTENTVSVYAGPPTGHKRGTIDQK